MFQADATSRNRGLTSHVLKRYPNISLMLCMNKCGEWGVAGGVAGGVAEGVLCKSFSFSVDECIIHSKTREEVPDDYQVKSGYTYYQRL